MIKECELLNKIQQMRFNYVTDKELAEHLGISPQYLYDILSKKRGISEKVANALGYTTQKVFVEMGSLYDTRHSES